MTRPAQCAFCSGDRPELKRCQESDDTTCAEWAAAYDEGVTDERARCAKIADNEWRYEQIAKKIRAGQ